jgi:hypothetical protein
MCNWKPCKVIEWSLEDYPPPVGAAEGRPAVRLDADRLFDAVPDGSFLIPVGPNDKPEEAVRKKLQIDFENANNLECDRCTCIKQEGAAAQADAVYVIPFLLYAGPDANGKFHRYEGTARVRVREFPGRCAKLT